MARAQKQAAAAARRLVREAVPRRQAGWEAAARGRAQTAHGGKMPTKIWEMGAQETALRPPVASNML